MNIEVPYQAPSSRGIAATRRSVMRSTSTIVVTAAGGLVLGGSAVAAAQIPGHDGVISACYPKSGGKLRILDAHSASCRKRETVLTWNQSGPQGPTGPGGPAGSSGPAGPSGAAGPAGADGAHGVIGFTRVTHSIPMPPAVSGIWINRCPPGKVALGGGASAYSTDYDQQAGLGSFSVIGSAPYEGDGPDGWIVFYKTTSPTPLPTNEIHFYVNCADVVK